MENKKVIQVKDLTKMYKLYDKPSDRLKEALGLTRKKLYKEHYALHDVNFDIYEGECVGIIGTNGSGKSTILKIITGVLNPTSGRVLVNGRISALLELGAGFNMEYNGIENVYLNAAATAMQVLDPQGRETAISYGANVVMPNLTPLQYREGYQLYDKKPGLKDDPETFGLKLEERIQSKGREVGWNLSGSSRKWLNRTGNSQEGYDGNKSASEQSMLWIKSTES